MNSGDEEFDEAWYLQTNRDVAQAVRAGAFRSGYHHYLAHGKAEGRRPRAMPVSHSLKPLDWPAIEVETSATAEQLNAMLVRVRQNFEFMGEREPHWSVVTDPRFLAENIESSEAEFFDSGKHPVTELTATAARCGLQLNPGMTCFELGCGLGRSTIWLAEVFGHVVGSDISAPHLRIAAATARRFGRSNASFVHIDRPELIDDLPSFDVFFSIVVLQHNPPPLIHSYLSRILRRLNPGGLAYFQLPTYRFGYQFEIARYLSSAPILGMPEMHVLPQPVLFALCEQARCVPVEVREDGSAGDDHHISQRFLVAKRAAGVRRRSGTVRVSRRPAP